ncbi:carbohydrate kinase family protein [Aliiroseovarius sp. 2305UL8-7]|uniref:carbohydrate kinase family protein n=1 Tax=Aliiroseovarius conchicola TaxID=3121637 RepID=UPI0035270A05
MSSDAILCAGRLYCDLVFTGAPNLPVVGTETFCDGLSLHAGGGAFITAAAFSALGWQTSLLATLPAAPFDTIVARDIDRFQIDVSRCSSAPAGASPQLTVAITNNDDRAFLSHKAGPALPNHGQLGGDFRHLHIGELRSLVEHPDLIAQAKQAGATVSVDCSWDNALLDQGSAMAELLSQVDVFLPNTLEYGRLACSGLRDTAGPLIVVKCGAEGARAYHGGAWIAEPAVPTAAIDTTGAGDAFNGGFLSAWLHGQPVEACLKQGNACGSAAVEHPGGTGGLSSLSATLAEDRVNAG